ncbi:hypothetical protein [Rufibacter hautae]|uniref:Lipoprotein n=1 Tax=Rufibacter hautae TaxID=2595005 RepID=A0A5B6TM51_9BACT|nr:hypothetical protein [Rufibacter hautae]KAA3440499.1 hypothetical protein FOA19_07560 [Rufibacter hautae]
MLFRLFSALLLIGCVSCSLSDPKEDYHALAAKEIKEKGFIASGVLGTPNVLIQAEDFTGVIIDKGNKDIVDDSAFTPTVEEAILAENIMRNCFDINTVDYAFDSAYINKREIEPLMEYRRQYSGFYNEEGERVIGVNCFRHTKEDFHSSPQWLRRMKYVKDGGNRFWRIEVNLKTKRCGRFRVNGLAFQQRQLFNASLVRPQDLSKMTT